MNYGTAHKARPNKKVTAGLTSGGVGSGAGGAADGENSDIVAALENIAAAVEDSGTDISSDVTTSLILYAGQALVVLASDYKAYFDLRAYSGSILKVAATGTLKVYGDLLVDNSTEFWTDNLSLVTIKGD